MFSHGPSERKLVRHVALTIRGGEIGFIAAEVPETEFRRKLQEKKGEFLLRAKPNGDVEAVCNSCRVPLVVAQKDQLHWFRCPRCHGVSFNPTPNVNRDIQFAIQDGKAFEYESNFVRQLPPGLVTPFSAEELGDLAWGKSPHAVIPLPDQPVGGTGAAGLQEVENAIAPYVQKARSTYPDAKRRFLTGLPEGAAFFTTVRLHDDAGGMEMVFVKVTKIDGGQVAGVIASDIDTVRGYRLGQAYTFPETDVVDWTISNPDGTQEGNVVGRFLAEWQKSGPPHPSQTASRQPTFVFTVALVFHTDSPVDRVILAGTVNVGTVSVGDSLTVQCQGGDVAVVLEGIVTLDRGQVRQASKGQEVSLVLRGIRKEQPARGDRVVANPA
jgi:uncharacterized protein YegJ (DUF2314 family)